MGTKLFFISMLIASLCLIGVVAMQIVGCKVLYVF